MVLNFCEDDRFHLSRKMPICPWPHLIVFVFGSGATLLSVSLVGMIAYNGKYGDDNKFKIYGYGMNQKISKINIAIVSCGVFTVVLLGISISFDIKHYPKVASLVMWILTFLCFLGTIILQIFALSLTKYGDAIIPSIYDYYKDNEFKNYIDTYYPGLQTKANGTVAEIAWMDNPTTEIYNVTYNLPITLDLPDFYVTFVHNKNFYSVASCVINWNSSTVIGVDPCNFDLHASECIGGWNSKNFKNYWCYAFRINRTYSQKVAEMTENEKLKYDAEKNRQKINVDSFSAFYEINSIFLGLNCAGFFIVMLAQILLMIINPFDKVTKQYKIIEASGRGSQSGSGKKSNGIPLSDVDVV
ncbi:hypothetical protein TRFO_41754 [Tritrichomonas foetus]|uniref:Uncharacterized protein n=1 Tax=Tritrichomonas foetus TaxID=1144522 RepID=A0A1J4L3M1_9EUKA|nr:hypothetical protein TRFO_41754 [Tritrichomonas foetus]|eukprot:OHT16517.1 hypothetical protein TRFO_41754 [Tritrichomonas foetus]